jgi:predicted AAA+ superfamily ATPase
VENAFGAHLCNSFPSVEYEITYWREGNHEVDFVVARGRDVWAIEIKSGRSGKASGLTRFRDRYPEARALLVRGQGISLETFFNRDAVSWLV